MGDLWTWLADPGNWQGPAGIPTRLAEHIMLSLPPVLLAGMLAVPLGILLGHVRRGAFVAISFANIGRAVPSFAILVLALPVALRWGLGLSYWPAFVALFVLAVPPILTNSYTGVREADPEVVEAGRGMGLREREVLWGVEIPLGLPLVLTGIRVAAVHVIATATLAALVAGGGLGRFIIDGFATGDTPQVVGGAILVAALAVSAELGLSAFERVSVSPGLRPSGYLDQLQDVKPG